MDRVRLGFTHDRGRVKTKCLFQRTVRYENRGFVVWTTDVRGGPVNKKKKKTQFIYSHLPSITITGWFYKRTNAHICAGIQVIWIVLWKKKKNVQYPSTTGKIVGRWNNQKRIINLFFFFFLLPPRDDYATITIIAVDTHKCGYVRTQQTTKRRRSRRRRRQSINGHNGTGDSQGRARCWYTRVYITCHRHVTHMYGV